MICIEKKDRHLSKKYVFTTRGGFGISRHNLHEWKRLGVGREMGTDCLAEGGQSGGRVRTLSCGEVAGSLKARVGESCGDMVGML